MRAVGLARYWIEAIGLVETSFGAADGFDAGGDDFEQAIFVDVAVEAAVRGGESSLIVAVGRLGDGERSVGALGAAVEGWEGVDAGGRNGFGGDIRAGLRFQFGKNLVNSARSAECGMRSGGCELI